jgi:hypothetical protein
MGTPTPNGDLFLMSLLLFLFFLVALAEQFCLIVLAAVVRKVELVDEDVFLLALVYCTGVLITVGFSLEYTMSYYLLSIDSLLEVFLGGDFILIACIAFSLAPVIDVTVLI